VTEPPRRAGSLVVLAGGILLAVVLVVIFLAPLATCPICEVGRAFAMGLVNMDRLEPLPESEFPLKGCDFCRRGRMSLYRKWRLSP